MKVVLALSGGLDSSTLLAQCLDQEMNVKPVFLGYGQTHKQKELYAAQQIASYYDINLVHYDLPDWVFSYSKSTLFTGDQPHFSYKELREQKGPSPTYVPFRNGLIISLLAVLAMKWDCEAVMLATHAEDAHNSAYPDCTVKFNAYMGQAIDEGTYGAVRLIFPFQYHQKRDIIRTGLKLNVPYELTWSCYEGLILSCGQCPTCVERIEAFRSLGMEDPLHYEESV